MTDAETTDGPRWIADRAVLRVFIQEHPAMPKEQVWEVTSEDPGFDYSWLYEEAGKLPYANGKHTPNVRELRHSRTDWGADAATFEVVLVVSKWLLEQGAAAAFGYAFNELVQQIRRRSRGVDKRPLTKDETIERARWKVAAAYEVDADSLIERSVEESVDGSWTAELEAPGATYEVTFEVEDGCVVTTRMKVTRRDGNAA